MEQYSLDEGNRWRFPSSKPQCAAYATSDHVELSPRAFAEVSLTTMKAVPNFSARFRVVSIWNQLF
jgi:hypothetical protein